MSNRILCPWHDEKTPSCTIYADRYKCYGCGRSGALSELKGVDLPPATERVVEDLEASLAYIDSLPRKIVRGLELPCDDRFAYIVWPGRDYYKRRFLDDSKPKYLGASGHEKPSFVAAYAEQDTLAIVEGELNALSLAKAVPEIDVVSPGSASEFDSRRKHLYLPRLLKCSNLLILADSDKAGALAVIEALGAVHGYGVNVRYKLMPKDLNDLLVEFGVGRIREEIEGVLG